MNRRSFLTSIAATIAVLAARLKLSATGGYIESGTLVPIHKGEFVLSAEEEIRVDGCYLDDCYSIPLRDIPVGWKAEMAIELRDWVVVVDNESNPVVCIIAHREGFGWRDKCRFELQPGDGIALYQDGLWAVHKNDAALTHDMIYVVSDLAIEAV